MTDMYYELQKIIECTTKIPYTVITASSITAKLAAELTFPCTFVGYVSSMISYYSVQNSSPNRPPIHYVGLLRQGVDCNDAIIENFAHRPCGPRITDLTS
jgi:hypothetical protein